MKGSSNHLKRLYLYKKAHNKKYNIYFIGLFTFTFLKSKATIQNPSVKKEAENDTVGSVIIKDLVIEIVVVNFPAEADTYKAYKK